MEAQVITLHGRQVCKLVDVAKVEKMKLMRLIWAEEGNKIREKYFEPVKVL